MHDIRRGGEHHPSTMCYANNWVQSSCIIRRSLGPWMHLALCEWLLRACLARPLSLCFLALLPRSFVPLSLTLLEHSYCILEGQLEVIMPKKAEEQTICVYQSSHSTPPTLLGHRVDEHTCMGLSIRLLQVMLIAHLFLYMIIMSYVQCATLQHEKLLRWFMHKLPAHHPGPGSTS